MAKKPVWFNGKIYPSTTDLARTEKIGIDNIYSSLKNDTPVRGHYIDYVFTFEDLIKYNDAR